MFSCIRCRRTFNTNATYCPHCRQSAIRFSRTKAICETNRCGHFVLCPKTRNFGCELLKRPCRLDNHLLKGGACVDDPPMFEASKEPGVFLPNRQEQSNLPPAKVCIRETIESIPPPKSDACIVVVAVGKDMEPLADITLPRMERYAQNCNADLVVLTDDQCEQWPIGNKLRFGAVAKQYSRSLLLDLDIWISDDAPDIFIEHDHGVWMHDDLPLLNTAAQKDLCLEIEAIAKEHSIQLPSSPVIRNSGVLLLEQRHAASWLLPNKPIAVSHTAEQAWIDLSLSSQWPNEMKCLEPEFNWLWFARGFRDGIHSAYFVHLANCPASQRMRLLQMLEKHSKVKLQTVC